MKRILIFTISVLVLPLTARADSIDLVNNYGTVSISTNGIASTGSELIAYNQFIAKPGHAMGTIAFTTGALLQGSVSGGGVFSSTGSTFTVVGKGDEGEPKGLIFSGSFVGSIDWTLVGQVNGKLVYVLAGSIRGMLYTGRMIDGAATETIYTSTSQLSREIGHLGIGHVSVGSYLTTSPEPDSLWLIGTGLFLLAPAASWYRSIFKSVDKGQKNFRLD